jgi:hypothetical protein
MLDPEDRPGAMEGAGEVAEAVAAMRKAGVTDAFLMLDPQDIGVGWPPLVIPVPEGGDREAVLKRVRELAQGRSPWASFEIMRGAVVAGTLPALDRLRETRPVEASALAEAMAAVSGPVRVIVAPGPMPRRVLDEALPTLPKEFGGGPMTAITQGAKWIALTIDDGAKPGLKLEVRARDEDAARRLEVIAMKGLDHVRTLARATTPDMSALVPILDAIKPAQNGDRVTASLGVDLVVELIAAPMRAAGGSARRSQCMNNLKQIALAMHNYASANADRQARSHPFPPAYSAGKDGKPLLSWRVLILPYIDQGKLYEKFHLDEPWDSPHNKALIPLMPSAYLCPTQTAPASDGQTVYLTPRGPRTIFPGAESVTLQKITDGTSNTILVIEANPDRAVTWTKPDDWEVGAEPTTDGVLNMHDGGGNVTIADGSVRFLMGTIDLKTFRALLTRDGGERIDRDKF